MNVSWEIGQRKPVGNVDKKHGFVPRLGKNKGAVIEQHVVKVYSPKGR